MKTSLSSATVVLLVLLHAQGLADWSEAIEGELSGNGLAPTPLTLALGDNVISGTMGRDLPQDPVDRDIFTFTLPHGQYLAAIHFTVFEPTNQSFFALSAGNTIDVNDSATHLANTLVKSAGEDALAKLVSGADSQGGGTWRLLPMESRVVGSSTYTVWFQELSSVVTYSTTYTVVPEPSTWLAVVGGVGMLLAIRKRRRA